MVNAAPCWHRAPRMAAGGGAPTVVTWAAASLTLAVQLDRLGHAPGPIAGAALASALGTVAALSSRTWPVALLRGAAVLVATHLLLPQLPRMALVVWAVAVAAWTLAGAEPVLARRPLGLRWRLAALAPILVGSAALVLRTGLRVPAAALGIGLAVAVGGRGWAPTPVAAGSGPVRPGLHQRALDAVGRPLGTGLRAVAMVPAAVLVVVVWTVQRACGVRPARFGDGTRLGARPESAPTPGRPFVVDDPGASPLTVRRLAANLVLLLLAVAGGSLAVAAGRSEPEAAAPPPAAECEAPATHPIIGDQPAWQTTFCESRAFVRREVFDATTNYVFPDAEGRSVNVVDGVRRTWRPPACDCRRVRVWWFGGSAAWGWFQRDDHTIPSRLARLAHEDGLVLDIENRAMPAWVLAQSVRRVEDLATTGAELPDLVVFYDGGNELNRQKERNGRGRGSDESDTSWKEAEVEAFLWSGGSTLDGPGPHPAGPQLSPEEVATHALNRYRRWVGIGRRVTEPLGVEPVFVWQPLMHSAPRELGRRDGIPEVDDPIWTRMVPAAVDQLPPEVLDLSDSLDDAPRPVFDDFYHTNELGADLVARALYERLEPRLRDVAERAEEGS